MPTNDAAIRHYTAKLEFETDVSDVSEDLIDGKVVVVDSRSLESWNQGHIPGALHLPTGKIARRAAQLVGPDAEVVVYCWGPGCNGATRAALEFARLGYRVKEMIGGFEYWVREGFPVEDGSGTVAQRDPDPLTAPIAGISCAC